jgi:ABC-type transporter Mla subunit MlaD
MNTPDAPKPLVIEPIRRELDDRARAVRVGVVVLVAIAIFCAAVAVTGPLRLLSGPSIDVDFAFCGPIKPGASVRLAGVVVGVVEDVVLLAGQDERAGPLAMVRVRAHVEERVAHLLTDRTQFFVTTLGVLGEHYLDIAPVAGTPLSDGARVDGVTLARADLLLPRASALLDRVDTLVPSSPELTRLMTATSSLVQALAAILESDETRAAVGGDVAAMRALIADVSALVRGVKRGIGDGGALHETLRALPPVLLATKSLEDDLVASGLGDTLREVQVLSRHTNALLERLEAGPLNDVAAQRQLVIDLTTTLRSLDVAARQADRVLGLIDGKKGAGRLVGDDAFADDVKAVVKGIRDNPMKLLFR